MSRSLGCEQHHTQNRRDALSTLRTSHLQTYLQTPHGPPRCGAGRV